MFPAGRADIRVRMVRLGTGVTVRVAESGDLHAPPVLLLHGWGASLYMWRDWFAPLASAGRRAIALDLPGHGLSDKPDDAKHYRLTALSQAVHELMRMERVEGADVVAQSMGGTIAIDLMTSNEALDGKLVLVNPAYFGQVRHEKLFRVISPSIIDHVLPRLVARWIVARAHRLVYGDPSRITARDEDEYWAPSQFPSYARAMRRLLHEFPWRRAGVDVVTVKLESLAHRLLVILGDRDRLVLNAAPYVARLHTRLPGLRVEIIEGGGHAVNEERPMEISSMVMRFLGDRG